MSYENLREDKDQVNANSNKTCDHGTIFPDGHDWASAKHWLSHGHI